MFDPYIRAYNVASKCRSIVCAYYQPSLSGLNIRPIYGTIYQLSYHGPQDQTGLSFAYMSIIFEIIQRELKEHLRKYQTSTYFNDLKLN